MKVVRKVRRWVVIARRGYDERAFGVFRSLKKAEAAVRKLTDGWEGYVVPLQHGRAAP